MLTREQVQPLLQAVAEGSLTPAQALEQLSPPAETLPDATVDHDRARRCGFAEVIYGAGKTVDQIVTIAQAIRARSPVALATRLAPEAGEALLTAFEGEARANPLARTVCIGTPEPRIEAGQVLVVAAGTSDLPVADEAVETVRAMGVPVDRITDVGVAGLHRLLAHEQRLREAAALVVVAGMEGALPSVVGGLVAVPVIAVPTSVGYGANFGGLAALLGMLNSCAAGVSVVNIDNGFGAGTVAARIALARVPHDSSS